MPLGPTLQDANSKQETDVANTGSGNGSGSEATDGGSAPATERSLRRTPVGASYCLLIRNTAAIPKIQGCFDQSKSNQPYRDDDPNRGIL